MDMFENGKYEKLYYFKKKSGNRSQMIRFTIFI